jgi:putative transcriptional regulator
MNEPVSGTLLIAEPFLKDPSFMRTVVLICKYEVTDGAFGFTLSKKLNTKLNEMINDMDECNIPVYLGGPVQTDTLHYIHQYPQYFDDAVKICEGVYWGGNFETLKALIKKGTIDKSKIKFFLGYSGWSEGQLEAELEEKSWITTHANASLIFDTVADKVWDTSLIQLGGKYKMMVHFPTDPQLN